MALSSTGQVFDDNLKLEPKVVMALSRLSKQNKSRKSIGVACKHIVEYLKANYCSLDGDIESQVLTALLSCVKAGTVCALENGKYLLPGPGSRGIISKCITRSSHGPKCSCSSVIKRVSKTYRKVCCVLKINVEGTKRTKRATTKQKGQAASKTKPRKCAQAAQQVLENRDTCVARMTQNGDKKCNYCFEIHPLHSTTTSQKLCKTCHPCGTGYVAPFDMFSPREEHM